MLKVVSTKLFRFAGAVMPSWASPTELNGEPAAEPFWAKTTLSAVVGAPGNCQFKPSDQLVVVLTLLVPTHSTEGRTPVGPLVSVSRTAVVSPLSVTLPT